MLAVLRVPWLRKQDLQLLLHHGDSLVVTLQQLIFNRSKVQTINQIFRLIPICIVVK